MCGSYVGDRRRRITIADDGSKNQQQLKMPRRLGYK